MRTIPRPKIIGAVFAVAALLLGFTAPAHAQQIVDLVSNTAVSTLTDGTYQLTHEDSAAQAFTTGSNRTGYDLNSIVVDLATFPASGAFDFAVKLWSGAADGEPGSVLCTLSSGAGVGTGLVRFFVTSLSSCPTPLTANTQYFVVMSFELTSNQIITDLPEWVFTLSGSEDSGAAAGWSISDSYYHRNTNSGPWVEGSASLKIKVKGAYTNQDRAALVALYDATDGDNWRNKTKWKSTDPLGNWRGVTTNAAGRVTGLDLRVNDLSGPIPSDLGDLTYLDTMNLAENTLSGLIPADLGDLTYLQTLNLGYNNGLTGSIPVALGNLTNLTALTLRGNDLSGPIPAALGGLTNLEILNLSTNKLTGSIPTALGGLTNLKDLSLFDNSLTGSIPVALGGLTNLEILNLTGTGLSGSLPVALGGLTNLTDLSLGANSLTGSIPTALGNLGNLKYLLLYSNSLTGSIPAALGGLTNLKNLELNANSLTGSIPAALGGLTNLTYLALDANSLTGSIPTELGNLTNLEGLSLNANSLTGSIPTELGDLSNLLELYVDNGLCVPAHTAFQQWLEDLENFGGDSTNICPNNAPTAAGKTVSTNEDMAYTFAAADFGFSDLDSGLDSGATLDHVKITALPGTNRGTLSLDGADISSTPATVAADQLDDSPDDNLKYTPPADANGNAFATFAFKVNDGDLDSAASYIITVDVSAVNDAAVATTDTAETSVGTAIIIGVLENDSDVDGDTLRVVEVGVPTAPSNGTAAINTNATTVTYTPDATFTAGADTFDYTVTDGLVEVTTSVTVTIIPARQNANLSNLTISSGTLTGDFAATTMSYAVEVGATTASVSVTPTTAEVGAAVTVNGRAVTSGSASDQIALALGVATAIPVNVTATDGTTIQTYTITVHRAADHTRPTVAITSEAAAPLTEAFTVTITFSEPVTGFELEDIRVTNGTASNFLEISPQEYTATITPDGSGEVRVEVPEEVAEAVAEDAAGNGNWAAEPFVIEADLERPAVTIEGPTEPVGMAGFEVTITFSEPVTGFELEDIRVTNGTASNFLEISPQEYTATITPDGSGEVRVEVPEEVAEDGAGNGNQAAEPFVIEADLERPAVTIEGPTEPVGLAGFEVTITFSEPVTGFELEDIRVTNGTASNFLEISPQEYTATITPDGSGEVRVEVPEEVAEDAAGNGNQAAEPFVIEADLKRPAVTIEGPTEPVGLAGFEVTITFSEPVTGFELEDIRVTNGTASNFLEISPQEYTATITPDGIGEVRVEVPENGAGNGNQAAEPFVIEADLERPAVTIEGPTEPVGMAGFEVTITFSEPVTGFELEDIRVTNGTASNFLEISPQEYTATITPDGSGEVRVEVPENVAGNGNWAAEPFVIEADLKRPAVTIEGPTEPVGMAGFEVTITFSEPVTGFELEDIRVTNGTASNFLEISPQEYTATITPDGSGEVRVEVPEDAAGNGNQAAEPFVIEADLKRPAVTIEGPTEPVGLAGFEVTITFSEPVTGFELEDIRVTNGTASNFLEISPQEYTATITPDGSGEVRVEVPEEMAEDAAGNGNQAAAAFEVETKLAVSYQEESYTAREGGETVTVTVKLSQGWDEELVIPIRVTRPATTAVADYTLDGLQEWDAQEGTGTLTFPAEETEQILRIAANHDGDGDDEMVKLGFGELPEIVMAGDPAVATVTLEDKGLVELKVSFGQTEYQIREGQQADIEVTVSPAADRRVEVPLVVAPKGGATDEDYSGVPSKVVFEEGESQGTISVAVLADEVNDPGEGIVLSVGELPEAVRAGEIPETTVNFTQQRTAEQFSQTLEVMLAVMARTMGESAQTAIEGRFERHRQWSRLGAVGGAVPTAQPGSDNSATSLGEGESQRRGSESLEGAGRRRAEGPVVPSAGGAAGARAAMGSSGESGDRESGVQGAWLQNVSLGGLAGLFGYGQGYAGVSTGAGRGPSGTGPTVGLGGQPGYGQNRFQGSETRNSSLRSGSGEYSGRRNQELNLAGVSLELPLAGQQKGTSRSWVPAVWGQGDLTRFNGNLTRLGMSYRGGLEAAHVGLDLYANDKVLAGLSFMRSWGNMDYSDDGIDGVLGNRMNTFHPYLYWQPTERVSVWGMGGVGRGQVDVNEPGRRHDFEADFRMFSGGARSVLSRRGHYEFGLRADAFTAQLGTAASEDIAKVTGHAHRARLMLEWVHDEVVVFATPGRTMYLKAEVGGRFDGGDADRGSGAETGFRLGYLDANSGLDVVMLGRVLVVHESDYRDWGLGVQASWDPGEKQRGVRVSVTSTRGQDGGGRTTLWNNANTVTRPPGMGAMGMSSQSLMESEVAYAGLTAPGVPGLLTPYSRLRWAGQGRELAWGTAWSLPPRAPLALPLMLELEAVRRETRTGPADLAVLVRMSTPF